MNHLFKLTLTTAFSVLPLLCDTVTITIQSSADAAQNCGSVYSCSSIVLEVPQFSGAGQLSEVDWTVTDLQQWYGGISDLYLPPGNAWSAGFTGGLDSSALSFSVTQTTIYSGTTTGMRQVSMGGWSGLDLLTASGTISGAGLAAWIGSGDVAVDLTPFFSTAVLSGFGAIWGASIVNTTDHITASFTEVDPVPEPGELGMILAALGLFAVFSRGRRMRYRN